MTNVFLIIPKLLEHIQLQAQWLGIIEKWSQEHEVTFSDDVLVFVDSSFLELRLMSYQFRRQENLNMAGDVLGENWEFNFKITPIVNVSKKWAGRFLKQMTQWWPFGIGSFHTHKKKIFEKNVPEERRKHFSYLIPNLCKFSQNNDTPMFSCLYVWRYYCAEF